MRTALFTDSEMITIEPKRKNGRVKYDFVRKIVEDTLNSVCIEFDGVKKVLYIRGKDMAAYESGERTPIYLHNEDGTTAKGTWRHGYLGSKKHIEPIYLFCGKLDTKCSYASGQIKDQHKYLLSI